MAQGFAGFKAGVFIGSLSSDPSGGRAGEFYFNSTTKTFRGFNGTAWGSIGGGGSNQTIGAAVGLSATTAFSANSPIKFDTVIDDTNSAYNPTTGLYTVPVSGWYQINFTANTSTDDTPKIYKNGSALRIIGDTVTDDVGAGGTVLKLLAGDTIGVYTVNATSYGFELTYFSIYTMGGVGTANGFDFFQSSLVNTNSTTVLNNTWQTFDNSPAFTIVPNFTGKYKVTADLPLLCGLQSHSIVARIVNTSGGATSLGDNWGMSYVGVTSGGAQIIPSVPVKSIFSLVAGNTYVFDFQGMSPDNAGSGTIVAQASGGSQSGAQFYMYAELCG